MTDFSTAADSVVQTPYYSATASVVSKVNQSEVEWLEEEMKYYQRRSPQSVETLSNVCGVLPAGVASCYHRSPTPFFVKSENSKGSKVVDIDGNRYIDFHSGYGVCSLGHQHPKVYLCFSTSFTTHIRNSMQFLAHVCMVKNYIHRFNQWGTHRKCRPSCDSVGGSLSKALLAIYELGNRGHSGCCSTCQGLERK